MIGEPETTGLSKKVRLLSNPQQKTARSAGLIRPRKFPLLTTAVSVGGRGGPDRNLAEAGCSYMPFRAYDPETVRALSQALAAGDGAYQKDSAEGARFSWPFGVQILHAD
jgi:hypothetical protein